MQALAINARRGGQGVMDDAGVTEIEFVERPVAVAV
jgi:hypothetical protein